MLKVTINGTEYSFDNEHYPLSEAIQLEKGLGMRFGEWEATELGHGSAQAMAGFVWLVLKRDGQDVPLDDILSGKFAMDTKDVLIKQDHELGPTIPPSQEGETTGSPPSASSTIASPTTSTPSPSPTSTGS